MPENSKTNISHLKRLKTTRHQRVKMSLSRSKMVLLVLLVLVGAVMGKISPE